MSGYVAGGASFAQLAFPGKESPLRVFGNSRLPSAGKSDFVEQEDFFEQDTSDAVHLNKDCSASSDFSSGILSRVMIPFVRCTSTSTAACDDLDPLEYADCEDHWSNSPPQCCNAAAEDWHDASQSIEELCAVEETLTPTGVNEEITYGDGVRGFIVRGAAPSIFALEVKLQDVKHLYTQKFGGAVDTESEEEEKIIYKDGVRGIMVRGATPSISGLDAKLQEVKNLYTKKFGGAADAESDEDEEIIYKDGVRGIMVRGATPLISALEAKLQEVKHLYSRKIGEEADAESDEDKEEIMYKDDVRGIMVRGAAPSIAALEAKFQDVKDIYGRKFGGDVDAESDEDEEEIIYRDGVRGIMVRGATPSISALEAKMQDVKELYAQNFGREVDAPSDEDEEQIVHDGVRGIMVRGAAPSISALEAKLQDVKTLYSQKFGEEVDAESDEDAVEIMYKDGVRGIMLRGAAPSIAALEAKLQGVKDIYGQKFGGDVNAESHEDDEEIIYKDDVRGIMIRGAAPSISALEAKLQDVKTLYSQKFGEEVDAEFDEDEEEIMYKDGVRGIMVRGAAPSIVALEAKLQDVKDIYSQKFGGDVDAESDEDAEEIIYQDGVRGVMVRGLAPSISALEAKLQDVKTLYSQKFGEEVNAESDEDVEEIMYKDGVRGIMLRGEAPSIAALEAKLQDVKDIYSRKFGGDVDAESDEDEIIYKDGVRGILIRGATPSISALKAKLQDVKTLSGQKCGEEVDAESDEDREEIIYKDGVRGIMVRGATPSIFALEAKLQVVRDIYSQKFGEEVDNESDKGAEEIVYEDGVRGIMARGAAPSISALEAKLEDVKDNYSRKFGRDVDAESDEDEEIIYKDGVRGIMVRGATPSIFDLEENLQAVKDIYRQKNGEEVDAEFDTDAEKIVYKDGARGIVVPGASPSISALEANVQDVNTL